MTEAAAYLELTDEHDDCIGRVVFDQWQVSVAPGARMVASLAAILKHKQPLVDVLVELSQTIRRPSQSSERESAAASCSCTTSSTTSRPRLI